VVVWSVGYGSAGSPSGGLVWSAGHTPSFSRSLQAKRFSKDSVSPHSGHSSPQRLQGLELLQIGKSAQWKWSLLLLKGNLQDLLKLHFGQRNVPPCPALPCPPLTSEARRTPLALHALSTSTCVTALGCTGPSPPFPRTSVASSASGGDGGGGAVRRMASLGNKG
jgi:hypothetical protein